MEPILAPTALVDKKRYLELVGWIETATLAETPLTLKLFKMTSYVRGSRKVNRG